MRDRTGHIRTKQKRLCFIQGSFPKLYTGTTRETDAVESARFFVLTLFFAEHNAYTMCAYVAKTGC